MILKQIDTPPSEWKSALDIFEHTLAHELKVTEMIHAIVKLAIAESDYATQAFMQWFVNEQVEEEAHSQGFVHVLPCFMSHGDFLGRLPPDGDVLGVRDAFVTGVPDVRASVVE